MLICQFDNGKVKKKKKGHDCNILIFKIPGGPLGTCPLSAALDKDSIDGNKI